MHAVVMTTIFPPSEAVAKFTKIPGVTLFVAGDNKTPKQWAQEGSVFCSISEQAERFPELHRALPENHYCRKNIGYLLAVAAKAQTITDSDDDNIPKDGWDFPELEGVFETSRENLGFVNVYKSFTKQMIWPRGLPLKRILDPKSILEPDSLSKTKSKVGIWQGLADGDPDVDAIYRLTNGAECMFDSRNPIVLARGTLSPLNSQNTRFRRELYPLLYLPCFVEFRFTDILRGYIAQPILWNLGYRVGIHEANVLQLRNPHDYLKDFKSEIDCYLRPDEIMEILFTATAGGTDPIKMVRDSYLALAKAKIVSDREMLPLEAWLSALKGLT